MAEEKAVKRKDATKLKQKPVKHVTEPKSDDDKKKNKPYKYGPMPTFPHQRVWARGILILGVFAVVYFTTRDGRELTLAKQKEILHQRSQDVLCSDNYKFEIEKYPGCVPQRCGRFVSDKLVSASEVDVLLRLARTGIALGGSSGGASILDLHSGALSLGDNFINVYQLDKSKDLFQKTDFTIYKVVKTKIQQAVANHFGIETEAIHLTHPTFFSRLTSDPPSNIHDEYWHPHVDKETYGTFHYTALLYLSDYGRDFAGGRFVYHDADHTNRTLEPRKGRVSAFTSGAENTHHVERVESGIRFALTVAFTCDPQQAIVDPSMMNREKQIVPNTIK